MPVHFRGGERGITDPIIHLTQAGTGEIKVSGLHRCRAAREHTEPVMRGMCGEVDKYVDAIGCDALTDIFIRNAGDRNPVIKQGVQALGHIIAGAVVGVGIQLDPRAVVARQ